MSLFDAIDRVESHKMRPFVAPIWDSDETRVFTVQDGVPYSFPICGAEAGWYIIDGEDSLLEAPPTNYLPFMSKLPRFYAIALFPVSDTTWIASPYNASDAEQRGWLSAIPKPVHNVRGTLRPLDIIDTRLLGGNLLYFVPASSVERDVSTPDFKRADTIVQARLEAIKRERDRKRYEEHRKRRLKDTGARFRHQLAVMGADLLDWREVGADRYEVTWEYNGAQFTVPVRRSGVLYSAGICLENTDDMHDLSSAVDVMETARKKHRFDLDRELWI